MHYAACSIYRLFFMLNIAVSLSRINAVALILQTILIILLALHNQSSGFFQTIVLSHLVASAFGYVVGSFPTAYFLVRWKSNIDIRSAGSGNVGTLNSYEVTNSKAIGAIVLLIDLLKGVVTVLLTKVIFEDHFSVFASAGIGAVVGHNFPVWLGFKGGRGLATGAGVMLMLAWMFVPLWMMTWFAGQKISKDVNVGNAAGILAVFLIGVFAPESLLVKMIPSDAPVIEFRIFIGLVAFVIGARLIEPVREFFFGQTT